MKKRLIKAGVLAVIFIAALVISSLVINRGTDDDVVDMGAPSLPRISFLFHEKEINPLFGYVQEMDLTAMRDTITPLNEDGTLDMYVEKDGNEISSISYTVYSLNGEESYKEGTADVPADGAAGRGGAGVQHHGAVLCLAGGGGLR